MVKISPSILSADFSILKDEIGKITEADYIHLDVMDGAFVPNLTFGAKLVKDIRKYTDKPFDVHLMVNNPENYIDAMADAGANIITIHYESCIHVDRVIDSIKKRGVKAGLTLVPSTHENAITYLLDNLDLILIMSVNPGFGGQKFLYSQLEKIKNVKKMIGSRAIEIEVDGGINEETAKLAIEAGADVLVAGSYVFNSSNYNEAIKKLKNE